MTDRRAHPRKHLDVPVRIFLETEEAELSGTLRDISLSGLFIHCSEPLIAGARCRVEVVLYEPDDPVNIWLEGRVARCERRGFGLAITRLYQDSFQSLRCLLLAGGDEELLATLAA